MKSTEQHENYVIQSLQVKHEPDVDHSCPFEVASLEDSEDRRGVACVELEGSSHVFPKLIHFILQDPGHPNTLRVRMFLLRRSFRCFLDVFRCLGVSCQEVQLDA